MAVNYDDKRFEQVETEKKAAIAENEKLYDGMIEKSDKFYQDQINNTEAWGDKQAEIQQQQTDFTIEKIEQQKDKLEKDYNKEQRAAYVDFQKAKDPHGVNAEQMAASGLGASGYSESSQVAMYTAYQNRVAVTKESFNQAVLEYDNMMNEARLQNSSALAQIAFETLQAKAQIALEGFQYENSLLMEKANQKTNIDNMYYGRRQDVLSQINTENALAEQKRHFNASLAEERRQFDIKQAQEEALLEDSKQFSTYEDAAAYMKSAGVATGDGGLMTRNEWARRKKSGSTATEIQYDSYEEYLNEFVAYRMANPQK